VWEGGTRSIAFIHAPPRLMPAGGRSYDGLLHISDWPATLVGLAGGSEYPSAEAKRAKGETAAAISGIDVWGAVSKALPSPRTDLLYNYDQVINLIIFDLILGTSHYHSFMCEYQKKREGTAACTLITLTSAYSRTR